MSRFRYSNHENQYSQLESRDMSWLEWTIARCAESFFSCLIVNSVFWVICKLLDDVFPKNSLAFLDVMFLPLEIFFITMVGVMVAARMLCIVMSKD